MHWYNKLFIWIFVILLLVVAGEAGYYYYLTSKPVGNYTNLYSLRTVSNSDGFTAWLAKNSAVSTVGFEVDAKNNPLVIVNTSGNVTSPKIEGNTASFSLKRDHILVNYTFPLNEVRVFSNPNSGTALSFNTLKENDSIIVHETFNFEKKNIIALDVRLVKNWEQRQNNKPTGSGTVK